MAMETMEDLLVHELRDLYDAERQLTKALPKMVKAASNDRLGMAGLIEEADGVVTEAEDDGVRDAAMIGAAQRVEHYEISAYGTARTFAQELGHEEVAELLEATLKEESAANELLTSIAESEVN